MNIIQITNAVCPSEKANLAGGVYRVVAQLSQYFVNHCNDICHNAYCFENNYEMASFFSKGLLLDPPHFSKFSLFLNENAIDAVVINFFYYSDYTSHISKICQVCHENGVKVIQCLHFMPGFESCSYGSGEEVRYRISAKSKVLDKLKKWIFTEFRPISRRIIQALLRERYLQPYHHLDKIVLFSEPYIDRYLSIVHKNDRNKFSIIPNPLSFPEYISNEEVYCKEKKVIVVGRTFEAQKRLSYAIKIWKYIENNPLLSDWSLQIVGGGYDEDFYRWLVKKYNLRRVSFEGVQDPKPYYRKASFMISTAAYEGWPWFLWKPCLWDVVACLSIHTMQFMILLKMVTMVVLSLTMTSKGLLTA